jgi:hypothetical protein
MQCTLLATWWAGARAYPDPVKYPKEARSLWQTSVQGQGFVPGDDP